LIIYKANFPNGKAYIGQTIFDLETRKIAHKSVYPTKNNVVYRAMRKYGWDNVTWEIIDYAKTIEELNEKEKKWIAHYNTYIGLKNANGYNMTEGGGGIFGYSHSEESKLLMSKNSRNTVYTEEIRLKMSKHCIGEGNNNVKITEEKAKEIKIRLASGDRTVDIVKDLNVTTKTVQHIKLLTSWKHVLPVLNDLLKDNTHTHMSEDIARDIKIRLSQGEKVNDLASKHNVSEDAVRQIRNLNSWMNLLPELNDKKYIDVPRVTKKINKNI